ncbi:unnamed protein product, partial [Mesorhabditis spiculigera]
MLDDSDGFDFYSAESTSPICLAIAGVFKEFRQMRACPRATQCILLKKSSKYVVKRIKIEETELEMIGAEGRAQFREQKMEK